MNTDIYIKTSKKSICHSCFNIKEHCSIATSKSCGTDSKLGMSFVQSCDKYNIVFSDCKISQGSTISVGFANDSRIDTIGGGFHKVEKYKEQERKDG